MRILQSVIALLLFSSTAFAQLTQPARFEKEQKTLDEDFVLINLEKEGIALFRETQKYKEGKHSWQLIILDTTLQIRLDTLIDINRSYGFIGHEYLKGKLNLLYQEGEFLKNKTTLCVIDLQRFAINFYDIKTELDLRLTHFSSIGNSILFGGYMSTEPAILLFDVMEKNVQVVPGFLQRNTELLDLRVNENNTFNVVLVEKIGTSGGRIIFRTFDAQAKLLLEDLISCGENRVIQTAISSSLQREDLLLTGTWSTRKSTKSHGFYTTLINPFVDQKLTLRTFGSLTHYLDFLKPRRAQKIKTKTKHALAEGKLYDYTNNVLPYKIIEHSKGYLVLAETYSPVSSTSSNYYNNPSNTQGWNNTSYYNNPYYNTYPTSRLYRPIGYSENVANEDEIKTYSSTLLSLNEKGEVENDYCLKLSETKIATIHQVTDAAIHLNDAYILYRDEDHVQYKKILQLSDDVQEGEDSIKLTDSFDELRDERNNEYGVRHWHTNNFYTWGYQTIRNQNLKGGKIREVFYINKLLVH